jgi:hypothetical protein
MVETLLRNGRWHVSLAQSDLIEQAGLDEKDFDYLFTHFEYKNKQVIVSHIFNEHLVVSMAGKEDIDFKTLIDAFSTVVEYKPFCKYKFKADNKIFPTYEWDKINPKGRYEELQEKGKLELALLEE